MKKKVLKQPWLAIKQSGISYVLTRDKSLGDMVALEAKYHTKCLLALYNNAGKVQAAQHQTSNKENEISGIVFADKLKVREEILCLCLKEM